MQVTPKIGDPVRAHAIASHAEPSPSQVVPGSYPAAFATSTARASESYDPFQYCPSL